MRILALECSTSSAKAGFYDSNMGMVRVREQTWPADKADVTTIDAEAAFDALLVCARETLNGEGVDALALCGIWHSSVPLGADMRPLSRSWTWANTDAAEATAAACGDRALVRRLYEETGCPPNSSYPAWQLRYRKGAGDGAALGARHIASLHGYTVFRLTGEFATSRCAESGCSFLNLKTGDWSDAALELAGFTRDMFPTLMAVDEFLPLGADAAQALGLPQGTPVVLGGADGAMNQVGAGAMPQGIMTLSVGTSAAIRLSMPEPTYTDSISTWCYYLRRGHYLAGAATSGAGNCVNWFRNTVLGGAYPFEKLQELAAQADGSLPIYLPFNFGERAPGYRGERKGGFCLLEGSHGAGHLYRALLEGVLFNVYHCYQVLTERAGEPAEIRISGGITRSPLWLGIAADLFGREMLLGDVEHMSLLGAVAVALKAMGGISRLEDFPSEITGAVQPDPARRDALLGRYAQYLDLYRAQG